MSDTTLKDQLAAVRQKRVASRRNSPRRSRLERFRAEIMTLREEECASSVEIATWLREYKRTKVNPFTVYRTLKKWLKPRRE